MIKAVRKALLSREISVEELINECKKNAKIAEDCNAFTTYCFDEALEKAEVLQKQIDGGNALSLCGIPVAIKDNIAYKDHILSCGSAILKDFVSPYSATAVENLQKSGALIIGKTNMDEFGMGSHSQCSCFDGVKNPINREFSAGGSSGGSAVAVKSGAAIASLGSDTGGSVRLPAAYCGICGLRPTYGAISRYGLVEYASSLDTIGTMGNTPTDCYELFSAVRSEDPRDSTSVDSLDLSLETNQPKLCSLVECFAEETDREVHSVMTDFLKSRSDFFRNSNEVDLSGTQFLVSAYYLLSSSEAASNLARFDGIKYGGRVGEIGGFRESLSANRTELFGYDVKKRIMLGNYCLGRSNYDKYYLKALAFREKLKGQIEALLKKYDAIAVPTSLIPVPRLRDTHSITKNFGNDKCNSVASLCGLPAISFPVGVDKNGMPVSLSIIGRKFGERYISELAERMIGEGERNV